MEIQPQGGNGFHYHRTFEETFTAVEGDLTVLVGDEKHILHPGESITAPRGKLHTFNNQTDKLITMQVRVAPAHGLEKSIRVAYGMSNTNKWLEGSLMTKVWRVALMLGYSETYIDGPPRLIAEPLINALAKIAQWIGADADIKPFFQRETTTA